MYYYHLYLSLYSIEPTELPQSIFDTTLSLPLANEDTLQLFDSYYHGLDHVGAYRQSTTRVAEDELEKHNDLQFQHSQPSADPLPNMHALQINGSDDESSDNPSMNNTTTITTTARRTNIYGNNDFRLGPIDVECIDRTNQKQKLQHGTLGYGIIHFYRDKQPALDDLMPDMLAAIPHPDDMGSITCTLAVPSSMTTQDFLTFVKPFDDTVLQYRFIRDVAPNKYMVLMKFKDVQSAYHYHHKFNGRPFHGMEPEICHIVFLASVTWMAHVQALPYPTLKDTLRVEREQQLPSPLCDTIELPTCPVCLERLDKNVTGLLGINCQHSFDCGCLGKWGDGNCHVCQFSEKPVLEGIGRDVVTPLEDSNYSGPRRNQQGWLLSRHANDGRLCCYVCGEMGSLWICMICGHIGCGRYQEAHAYDHYMETCHLFALEIDTQRVWDYEGDGYVHRLLQNTVDGKLVEFPGSSSSLLSDPSGDGAQEKNDVPESSSSSSRRLPGDEQRSNTDRSGARLDGWYGYGGSSAANPTRLTKTTLSTSSSSSSAMLTKPSLSPPPPTKPSASSAGSSLINCKSHGSEGRDAHGWSESEHQHDKLEAMSMEYTTLLTSQLESQRIYYEDQLDALTRQLSYLTAQKSDLDTQHQQAVSHHHQLTIQSTSLQHENETLQRAQTLLRGKDNTWKEQYEVERRKWEEEKKVTTALSDENAALKRNLEEKRTMVTDMNEELRDLTFFVEARNTIQQQMPDMVGGSVGTAQRTTVKSSSQHRRGGKKGKKG